MQYQSLKFNLKKNKNKTTNISKEIFTLIELNLALVAYFLIFKKSKIKIKII